MILVRCYLGNICRLIVRLRFLVVMFSGICVSILMFRSGQTVGVTLVVDAIAVVVVVVVIVIDAVTVVLRTMLIGRMPFLIMILTNLEIKLFYNEFFIKSFVSLSQNLNKFFCFYLLLNYLS